MVGLICLVDLIGLVVGLIGLLGLVVGPIYLIDLTGLLLSGLIGY